MEISAVRLSGGKEIMYPKGYIVRSRWEGFRPNRKSLQDQLEVLIDVNDRIRNPVYGDSEVGEWLRNSFGTPIVKR